MDSHKPQALFASPGRGHIGDGRFAIFMSITNPHNGRRHLDLESIGYASEPDVRDALAERRSTEKKMLDATVNTLRADLERQQAQDKRDGMPADRIEERSSQVKDLLDNLHLPDYVAFELRPVAETPVEAMPVFRVGDEPDQRAA